MKVIAILFATLAAASAFAPKAFTVRSSVQVAAFWDQISGMDLFTPNKDQNDYGAYKKKNLKAGKVGPGSYVPAGLSLSEYQKIRAADEAKKEKNYQKNASKAGKFISFDSFYMKRGTDVSKGWVSDPTKGHTMAKTKYDYSGEKDEKKNFESFFK